MFNVPREVADMKTTMNKLLTGDWWQQQPDNWRFDIATTSDQDGWASAREALLQDFGEPDLADEANTAKVMVWDFDYYLLILRVDGLGVVSAEKKVPGWGGVPDETQRNDFVKAFAAK